MGIKASKKPSPLDSIDPDELNAHFAAVSSAWPPVSAEDLDAAINTECTHAHPLFRLRPASEDEILRAIGSLGSRGSGVDGITAREVKLSSASASLLVDGAASDPHHK